MTLPEGLKWLQPGWWLVHAVAVLMVYWWGYKKGRESLRKELRAQTPEAGNKP